MSNTLTLMPGTTVGGHYSIGALINRGGFGAVYRGIDTSEGNRPCAIKETYDVTPAARRQALIEAAVLFTVKSKHLPRVYDAFEDTGRFYLVMQLIEGQDLLEISRQRSQPCSEQEVLGWLIPVMEVLDELHSRNPAIMHRDIKPGNIIIAPDQTSVLVDFGLTKLYDPGVDTQSNVRAVSEGFSPIEQYIGKTSPQSDIYSLAATMYFLLTGYTPLASIQRSVHDDLIPPRRLNPQLSPPTEAAILKAMALHADFRYPTMREFMRALRGQPQVPQQLLQPYQPAQSAFNGYADQTISDSSVFGAALLSPIQIPSTPALPRQSSQSSQPQPGRQQSRQKPGIPPAQVYPILPARPQQRPRPIAPGPGAAMPMPLPPTYMPLPGAYNQGCLWGVLQGILSALLVLTMKNQSSFYVAISMGLLFYVLAGFMTARKGGSSLRGIWAGFWAGVSSSLVFWAILLVGLFVLVGQYLQKHPNLVPPGHQPDLGAVLGLVFKQVLPVLANRPTTTQGNNPIVTLLIAGLICAVASGLLGGILGGFRFRARMRRKGYTV